MQRFIPWLFSKKDLNIIAKECVFSYIYFVKINETHKECLERCLNGKGYYAKESESLNQCYEKCHSSSPYHQKDDFKCLEKCPQNFED